VASNQRLNVEITATDRASSKVDDVARKVDNLDGESADVRINADTAGISAGIDGIAEKLSGLGGPVGSFGGQLGALASPSGAIAGIAGGLLLAADSAADVAIEADNLASLTGDSVDEASRLNAVWKQTGADTKDLQDVLLQMNGVLATDADLAKELGINLNDGATVGQRFQQVADALDLIPDAAQRSQIASRVFGEEGVRQYNAMRQAVGDLGDAMANVSEGSVISEEDVENAREFKRQMTEVKAELAAMAATIGSTIIPVVLGLAQAFNDVADKAEDMHLDDVARWVTPIGAIQTLSGAVKDVGGWFGIGGDEAEEFDRALAESGRHAHDYRDALLGMGTAHQETIRQTQAHRFAMRDSGRQAEDYERALTAQAEAYQALKQEQDAVIEAARSERDSWAETYDALVANKRATDDLREAQRALADQTYGLHDAELALEQAITSATETLANEETTLREARGAMEDVATAADDAAQKQLALNGQTINTTEGMNAWIESMLTSASTLEGPLREEVLNHISAISGIPRDVLTQFGVEIDAARLREIAADLDFTSRERFVRFTPTGNIPRYASGTRSALPGIGIAGEDGPELIKFNGGERVFSANETAAMLSTPSDLALAASPGTSVGGTLSIQLDVNVRGAVVTNHVELGRQIAEPLIAYFRNGGDPAPFQRYFGNAA
jgi:hypothetical protein